MRFMKKTSESSHESPFPYSEVSPQIIPVPETKKESEVPIEVVNGALEEVRRREREEERGDVPRKPTLH